MKDLPPPTPQHGQLLWKLGDAAPLDATIDQNSGNVQWLVPSQLSTAAYVIPVELHFQQNGTSSLVASTQLVASVQSDNVAWVMPPAPPARIKPGQSFSWTPEISPKLQPDAGLRFRLARTEHSDIALDPANGTLTWTPDVSDLGRHPVTVELVDADEKKCPRKSDSHADCASRVSAVQPARSPGTDHPVRDTTPIESL